MLSDDEKRTVAHFLGRRRRTFDSVVEFGVFILPTLAFAGYGLFRHDFLAVLIAYAVLLTLVILYLGYARRSSELLRSALEKYEAGAGALDGAGQAVRDRDA